MFRWQHGAHRQGLGALLSYFVEPHLQWNSRAETFMATAIVSLAALCALYLKTRLWGPLSFPDIAIPLIFFTPAQYESLWETPNFSYSPLPLLLVVLYCLGLTCERAVTRYALVLVINVLAIYTGYGLLVGFITPCWLILEYYWRRAAGQGANLRLHSTGNFAGVTGIFLCGLPVWCGRGLLFSRKPFAGCLSAICGPAVGAFSWGEAYTVGRRTSVGSHRFGNDDLCAGIFVEAPEGFAELRCQGCDPGNFSKLHLVLLCCQRLRARVPRPYQCVCRPVHELHRSGSTRSLPLFNW